MTLDICGERTILEDNSSGVGIKVQSEEWELNICFHLNELTNLKRVIDTPWINGSIKAGKSAGSDVFWSCENDMVSILIGHDDQTWDFGVFIPKTEFVKIVDEFQKIT